MATEVTVHLFMTLVGVDAVTTASSKQLPIFHPRSIERYTGQRFCQGSKLVKGAAESIQHTVYSPADLDRPVAC